MERTQQNWKSYIHVVEREFSYEYPLIFKCIYISFYAVLAIQQTAMWCGEV